MRIVSTSYDINAVLPIRWSRRVGDLPFFGVGRWQRFWGDVYLQSRAEGGSHRGFSSPVELSNCPSYENLRKQILTGDVVPTQTTGGFTLAPVYLLSDNTLELIRALRCPFNKLLSSVVCFLGYCSSIMRVTEPYTPSLLSLCYNIETQTIVNPVNPELRTSSSHCFCIVSN